MGSKLLGRVLGRLGAGWGAGGLLGTEDPERTHMPDELLATMPPIMAESMEEGSGPILYCTGGGMRINRCHAAWSLADMEQLQLCRGWQL